MNIYLDMDDVVADWIGYAEKFLEHKFVVGEMIPDHLWKKLKSHERLYSELPLKEGAHELVAWVTRYCNDNNCNLRFLSAIPHNNDTPWAVYDKVVWAQHYFPHVPVFLGPYSHDKWKRCESPEDILIDDRRSNIEEWQRAGGRGHIYTNWPECKKWLEETLNTNYDLP